MPIKNFYNISPNELIPGTVLVAVVTLHVVGQHDRAGRPYFRLYRTFFPPETLSDDGVPQGARVYTNEDEIAAGVFPVVSMAGLRSDEMVEDKFDVRDSLVALLRDDNNTPERMDEMTRLTELVLIAYKAKNSDNPAFKERAYGAVLDYIAEHT